MSIWCNKQGFRIFNFVWKESKLIMTTDFGVLKNPMILLLVLLCSLNAWTQEEKEPFLDDFRGTASVTHNGISLVPSFSLGDPHYCLI